MIKKLIISSIVCILCLLGLLFGVKPYVLNADVKHTWYTFNIVQPLQNEGTLQNYSYNIKAQSRYSLVIDPSGNNEILSNTINGIYIANDYMSYYVYYYDIDRLEFGLYELVVYYAGDWVNDNYRYIFLDSDITNDLLEYLENNGIFDLVETLPNYSFNDLFLNIANIIPNTIKSMTSFEILGFTLFAIIGTFVLVLLILKIIKGVV